MGFRNPKTAVLHPTTKCQKKLTAQGAAHIQPRTTPHVPQTES